MTPTEIALVDFARGLRDRVRQALLADRDRSLAAPDRQGHADLQYAIDRVSEEGLHEAVARSGLGTVRLLSEGLDPEGVVMGAGEPRFRLLLDPIDGTRGLMHDKRSGFVIAALAPERPGARLADVVCSALVEIPGTRSGKSDVFAATRGGGVKGFTEDLATGGRAPLAPRPSTATTLAHGFATFARFLPGAMDRIGAFAEDFFDHAFAGDPAGRGAVFEDQYISTGGQFHAILTGRDRFAADLRPLFRRGARGPALLCAHPYDVGAALLLSESGVPLTDEAGRALDAPMEITGDIAWVAWASAALRAKLEPFLLGAIAALR